VFGSFDAQSLAVGKKGLHVLFRVVANGNASSGRVGDDAVIHIGEVHDVIQLETAPLQETAKNILKNKGAEIADVRIVVSGGAARVHANFAGFLRDEGLNFCGEGIVDLDRVHFARSRLSGLQ